MIEKRPETRETSPPRRRRRRWLLIALGVFLGLLFVLGGIAIYIVTWDIPPADDSDLEPERASIEASENGFLAIRDLAIWKDGDVPTGFDARITWHSDGEDLGWNSQRDRARLAVEKNAGALAALREALDAPGFQVPELRSVHDTVPYLSPWREIVGILSAEARLELESDALETAVATILDQVRFGHRVENAGGDLITYLRGAGIKLIGLSNLRAVAERYPLSIESTRAILDLLQEAPFEPAAFITALKVDYFAFESFVENPAYLEPELAGMTSMSPWLVSPNHSMSLLAESMRRICANAELSPAERTAVPFPVAKRADLLGVIVPLTLNYGGRQIVAHAVPTYESMLGDLDRFRFELAATKAIVALRAYESATGVLPDSLETLVPAYLAAAPVDPYDRRPLRYSREKRRVWAVGDDLVDDGGSEPAASDDDETPSDPTVVFLVR